MVEIKNLSFGYRKSPVLTDISVNFKKGNLYGIIGPNGCGKSTLLSLMAGLLRPGNGNILIENRDVSTLTRKELSKKISLMPQIRPTPDMTAFDLVMCGRYPYRTDKNNSPERDEKAVLAALSLTNTAEFADRRLNELSGGERQRVYLAMLLAQNTETVLCDEPCTHLDIGSSLSVMELLKGIKNQDKCVIAVLHDLSHALRFCDEIILINDGVIVDIGTPNALIDNKSIDKVFGINITPVETKNGINYIFE